MEHTQTKWSEAYFDVSGLLYFWDGIGKTLHFFLMQLICLWNSSPEEVVAQDSLRDFKSVLHESLGSILYKFD